MSTLEKVIDMKNRGNPETQIIQSLREQGISPREINEAISQSKIKNEIAGEPVFSKSAFGVNSSKNNSMAQSMRNNSSDSELHPSIMPSKQEDFSEFSTPVPQGQSMSNQPAQDYPVQVYKNSTRAYPENVQETEQYAEPYYQEYQPTDIETINDIAEQIVEEKNEKLKKQIASFTRFKEEIALEIEKINKRLERIENVFNEMQVAILRKIGQYGTDIKDMADEVHQTQESFSKIIDPLTDNINELRQITSLKAIKPKNSGKPRKTKSDSEANNFESYLR